MRRPEAADDAQLARLAASLRALERRRPGSIREVLVALKPESEAPDSDGLAAGDPMVEAERMLAADPDPDELSR
ncbi:hypothetical protein [Amnibacterium kyonggiense]|uniref:hypothetical protein n=1 Tax=Amnibacterium kyonggiense TaxID=595671 RepID=UPI00105D70BE|nr:hypothetical protein [Amnibacterium kyonggiense]